MQKLDFCEYYYYIETCSLITNLSSRKFWARFSSDWKVPLRRALSTRSSPNYLESIEMLLLHNCPCQKSKQIKIRRYEILWVFLCQNPLSLRKANDAE